MTAEHDVPEGYVKIRTTRHAWVQTLVFGGIWLAFAIGWAGIGRPFFALCWLVLGCASIGKAFWVRTMGVDLTPESANVRGVRRRSVPWKDVQALVHHRGQGTWVVRLILESGKPVMLPAPTTWSGFGRTRYEQDFHRIGQWWLAHRGESWCPVVPEAPQAQEQGQGQGQDKQSPGS
jgi:hypothetical protein